MVVCTFCGKKIKKRIENTTGISALNICSKCEEELLQIERDRLEKEGENNERK